MEKKKNIISSVVVVFLQKLQQPETQLHISVLLMFASPQTVCTGTTHDKCVMSFCFRLQAPQTVGMEVVTWPLNLACCFSPHRAAWWWTARLPESPTESARWPPSSSLSSASPPSSVPPCVSHTPCGGTRPCTGVTCRVLLWTDFLHCRDMNNFSCSRSAEWTADMWLGFQHTWGRY